MAKISKEYSGSLNCLIQAQEDDGDDIYSFEAKDGGLLVGCCYQVTDTVVRFNEVGMRDEGSSDSMMTVLSVGCLAVRVRLSDLSNTHVD